MYSKSENTKTRCNNDANEVFDKVIESIHSVYQDAVVLGVVVYILILQAGQKRKNQQYIQKIQMINAFNML